MAKDTDNLKSALDSKDEELAKNKALLKYIHQSAGEVLTPE